MVHALQLRGGALQAAPIPDTVLRAPIMQLALYLGTLMGALSGCERVVPPVHAI